MRHRLILIGFIRRSLANVLIAFGLFYFPLSNASAQLGDLLTEFNLSATKFAVDSLNHRMYISSNSQNTVTVIDTNLLTEIATIPVTGNPAGLSLSADGSTLYVAASSAMAIHVIDTATKQVTHQIPVNTNPFDVAATNNGRLFATPVSSGPGIQQIDAGTGITTDEFSLGVFIYQRGLLQLSPDYKTLYFANVGSSPGTLAAFDITTENKQLVYQNSHGVLGSNGQDLALSKDGQFISYVVGSGNELYDIFKINTTDFVSAGSFATGAYPRELTYSNDGQFAYAVHMTGQIDVFDTTTFELTGTISTNGEASELEVDASGEQLYAAFPNVVRVYSLLIESNTPPQINISSPIDGSAQTSELVSLNATANDAEDGDLSFDINWNSNIDGDLGTGANLVVPLSPGQHLITASVTDNAGATVTTEVTVIISTYCTSYGQSTSYEWIESITVANVLFASGNDGGYGDFSNSGVYLDKSTHSVTLTPGFQYGAYTEYWRIWIDLNQNGVFDNNELLFSGNFNQVINTTINIPASALPGHTRMRISMRWGTPPDACGSFSWGEVEDYSVSITE